MKKMLLSLIIAVCLLSITVCPVFAKYASDLGMGYQFLSEVNYMLDNGYMSYTEVILTL